jgi:hypothetical protein
MNNAANKAAYLARLLGGTLLFWSPLMQLEQLWFGTPYVAAFFVVNAVLGAFGAYVRYLIRTGYQPEGLLK